MILRQTRGAVAACAAAVLLTGCGGDGLRTTFGFKQKGPDPFAVTLNTPIELPPGDSLPLPDPQAGERAVVDPQAEARRALGLPPPTRAGPTRAEQALLAILGAESPQPGIRSLVEAEIEEELDTGDQLLVHVWLGLADREYARANALSPSAEVERLRASGVLARPQDAGVPAGPAGEN